jgi:hypothetical protein
LTSVGYKLYREICDFAPPDWSSPELTVAWVIADDASDATRASWIPLPLLCARTRLAPSSVRAALAKLAGRGYEFRVIKGYGKDGRPVFATRSHAVDYLVPSMLIGASNPAPMPVDNPPERRQEPSGYSEGKALGNGGKALGNDPKGARILAPLSSDLLTIPSAEALDLDASPVESARATPAAPVETRPRHHHQPGAPPPFGTHWVSPIERAARQAAEARHRRDGGTPCP